MGVVVVPLAGLRHAFAALKAFGLGEVRARLVEGRPRIGELALKLLAGAQNIVAPRGGGARIGGIGEMGGVADAGALLLGGDLAVEFARHAGELGHHHLDLGDATAPVFDLETLQADQCVPRLHYARLQRNSNTTGDAGPIRGAPARHLHHEGTKFRDGYRRRRNRRDAARVNFRSVASDPSEAGARPGIPGAAGKSRAENFMRNVRGLVQENQVLLTSHGYRSSRVNRAAIRRRAAQRGRRAA